MILDEEERQSHDELEEIEEEDPAKSSEDIEFPIDQPSTLDSSLFPLPETQERIESELKEKFATLLEFIATLLEGYHRPETLCAYCGEVLVFETNLCANQHCAEVCART